MVAPVLESELGGKFGINFVPRKTSAASKMTTNTPTPIILNSEWWNNKNIVAVERKQEQEQRNWSAGSTFSTVQFI